MPMNARRLLAPAPYRARVTPPSSPGPRPGRSGRLPWALAALAAWVSLAACSDDPSAAGPDSAAPDATAPDTVDAAEGPDSAAPDVADDVAAPDVLPADTADVPEPADTAPPADATEPPDALVPPDFPLTCTVHADCLTPCATVRAIGPAVSWLWAIGMIPARLASPRVGLRPTTPLTEAGETIEPSVSVPMATAHKLAATATAEPELDPEGFRSSA